MTIARWTPLIIVLAAAAAGCGGEHKLSPARTAALVAQEIAKRGDPPGTVRCRAGDEGLDYTCSVVRRGVQRGLALVEVDEARITSIRWVPY
jgi:hypothetical protein